MQCGAYQDRGTWLVSAGLSWFEQAPERIVVVRALPGLGDLLCAVPALRAVRAVFPQAHITLIGLPQAQGFVERFQCYLDEWMEFPGYPGMERAPQLARLPAFLTAVHARRFDLALQMHGSGSTSNPFTVLLGAQVTAGCFVPGQYCPDDRWFLPYPEQEHEIWRLLRLVELLGVPLQGESLELPLDERDWRAFDALAGWYQLDAGSYACVHAGASSNERRWAETHFAAIADALLTRGLRVVLTGTPGERPLTRAVAQAMRGAALDLAGQTSLGSLAVLLRGARMLVCNDTGVSHLAAAVQCPSVVIFSGSDPARWAPLDRTRHRAVVTSDVWEQYGRCARGAGLGLPRATLAGVMGQVDALLEQEVGRVIG